MTRYGPGKHGGSTRTVRKRAQRKRAKAREQQGALREQPTLPVRPTAPPQPFDGSTSLAQLKSLSYEVSIIAAQLRKAGANYGHGISRNDSIIEDSRRAYKIIEGFLRENDQRNRNE